MKFSRDPKSGALVASDHSAYLKAKQRKDRKRAEGESAIAIQKRINTLEVEKASAMKRIAALEEIAARLDRERS
jgi:hypothetical protein